MTVVDTVESHLAILTEGLTSPIEARVMLKPSLELALRNLGHDDAAASEAVDSYLKKLVH